MLEQLKIENYRCFKSFELNQLGRVNLLVGENNCGKTSILEAIQLFYAQEILSSLKKIALDRGEFSQNDQFNISHFCNGHHILEHGKILSISGINNNQLEKIYLLIIDYQKSKELVEISEELRQGIRQYYSDEEDPEFINLKPNLEKQIRKKIKSQKSLSVPESIYNLSSEGYVLGEMNYIDLMIEKKSLSSFIHNNSQELKTRLVNSASLTVRDTLELFNQVVLIPRVSARK